MNFTDLPYDILSIINDILPWKSVTNLSKTCNFLKDINKEYFIEVLNVPWRIAIEQDEDQIHQVWVKIGWFRDDIEAREKCDYCKNRKWIKKSHTMISNDDIKTVIWSGIGGEIAYKILSQYPSLIVEYEKRGKNRFPVDVSEYKVGGKRKRNNEIVADVEIGKLAKFNNDEPDFDHYRIKTIVKTKDYKVMRGVRYGLFMYQ